MSNHVAIKDSVLKGTMQKFNLEEEFKVFLARNWDVRNSSPEIGFLLFLIEQQRSAIQNLEQRVYSLEGQPQSIKINSQKKEYSLIDKVLEAEDVKGISHE